MRADRSPRRAATRLSAGLLLAGAVLGLALIVAAVRAGGALALERPSLGELVGSCRTLVVAPTSTSLAALLVLLIASTSLFLAGRNVLAIARSARRTRRLCRDGVERFIGGQRVRVVPGRSIHAFCGGLRSPKVVVSRSAVEQLETAALHAVVAHEAAHVRRRDPLRLAVLATVADAAFFLPLVRHLVDRHAALTEIVADQAAAAAAGRPAVARALLAFDHDAPASRAGRVDPRRVDALLGRCVARPIPRVVVIVTLSSLLILAALTGVEEQAREARTSCTLVVVGLLAAATLAAAAFLQRRPPTTTPRAARG